MFVLVDKEHAKLWTQKGSPPAKKVKPVLAGGKIVATVFWAFH